MNGRARPIRTVLFDVDQTLVDFLSAMRHALVDTLVAMDSRVGPLPAWLTVEALVGIRDSVADELRGQAVSLEEVRRAGFLRALQLLGCGDRGLAEELACYYQERRFAWTTAYPDVAPALQRLSVGRTLGVVSNGNSYPERWGLGHLFGFCVFSHDHGIEKPDARLFLIALRRAACQAAEALHVGDSLETDVLGAQQVGITAVWLNRDGTPNGSDIRPDVEIRSLLELPDVCEALRH